MTQRLSTTNEGPSTTDSLERLRQGNARFVAGQGEAPRSFHPGLSDVPSPFAVILGCSDARAPAEYVFDQGLGDLFVIRVAGNIVAPSLVGSVEFATGKFGTRLVVVMGHTHCGAVAATVDALEHGGEVQSRNMRSIVDRITPHVKHLFVGEGDHEARLAAAVRANTLAVVKELRDWSPALKELIAKDNLLIVGAVLHLETGVVEFLDP